MSGMAQQSRANMALCFSAAASAVQYREVMSLPRGRKRGGWVPLWACPLLKYR
ncbi:MAG: hypothetical protein GY820_06055 [Gammaproteobacteria bacterium]|nr:hypothetical protein [Gammaproteobacteria bacterium]